MYMKNSTKKVIKKKRIFFLFFLVAFLVAFLFSYFLVFFYKFPPQFSPALCQPLSVNNADKHTVLFCVSIRFAVLLQYKF